MNMRVELPKVPVSQTAHIDSEHQRLHREGLASPVSFEGKVKNPLPETVLPAPKYANSDYGSFSTVDEATALNNWNNSMKHTKLKGTYQAVSNELNQANSEFNKTNTELKSTEKRIAELRKNNGNVTEIAELETRAKDIRMKLQGLDSNVNVARHNMNNIDAIMEHTDLTTAAFNGLLTEPPKEGLGSKVKNQADKTANWFSEKWNEGGWGIVQAILGGAGLTALGAGALAGLVGIFNKLFGNGDSQQEVNPAVADHYRQEGAMAVIQKLQQMKQAQMSGQPTLSLPAAGSN